MGLFKKIGGFVKKKVSNPLGLIAPGLDKGTTGKLFRSVATGGVVKAGAEVATRNPLVANVKNKFNTLKGFNTLPRGDARTFGSAFNPYFGSQVGDKASREVQSDVEQKQNESKKMMTYVILGVGALLALIGLRK